MNNKLALSLAIALASSAAVAKDGFYVSGLAGYVPKSEVSTSVNFEGVTYSDSVSLKRNFLFTPAFGYKMDDFRFELGLPLFSSVKVKDLDAAKVTNYGLLFNVYRDFPLVDSRWVPYVGAGIGASKTEVDVDGLSNTLKTRTAFTYQLIAGTQYRFTCNLSGTVDYRFYDTKKTSFDAASELKASYRAHTINFGLMYSFA